MGWRDLLATKEEIVPLLWLGGKSLRSHDRKWSIGGRMPGEHGWYNFEVKGRKATMLCARDPQPGLLRNLVRGYLVGDRLITDAAEVNPDPATISASSERVHLIDTGLDRFCRISAGRVYDDGPLVFFGQEFPMGPESEVLNAYLDKMWSVKSIRGISPALDAAFRMEVWQREIADQRRAELERIRLEEEARLAQEERRVEMARSLGDGAGRRDMALHSFEDAARAALAVGGAEILDVRDGRTGEKIVRYRLDGRRYECICDMQLRIIDAGVCLTDERTGEKGDDRFTLESLPGVIRQADRQGVLVVFRHV